MTDFFRENPCKMCPFRKDVPLQVWSLKEMVSLSRQEKNIIKDCDEHSGHVCVGWLMDQNNRGVANMRLGLELLRNNISHEYLLALSCDAEVYEDLEEMARINYPAFFDVSTG